MRSMALTHTPEFRNNWRYSYQSSTFAHDLWYGYGVIIRHQSNPFINHAYT
jgi:hypothetical protein